MARPICVHCGKPYGRRYTRHENVSWDTPHIKTKSHWSGFMQKGNIAPPPPYRGNGHVVKESSPYVSAETGKAVMIRYIWDGESWTGGFDPFCTLRCALDYARKAYKVGRAA